MEDYPIYDAHMHMAVEDPALITRYLDACGVAKAVVLNLGYGKDRPNKEYEMGERVGFELLERYPDRVAVFCTVDFSLMDEPDFAERAAVHLEESVKRGVSGLKLWLGKPIAHWMPLNDPRMSIIYEKAAELGVPVTIHVGDPSAFWEPLTPDNFWYEVLKRHPDWSYCGKPVPSRAVLLEEQRRMLEAHPRTIFISAHLGGSAEDLQYLGRLLDEYPNLYVDTTACEPWLGQDPDRSRSFLLMYQDRILFGTDNQVNSSSDDFRTAIERMRVRRLFYETDIEQVDLDCWRRRPGYTIRGVNLPPAALHKIYHENAARLIPALARIEAQ